MRSPAARSLLRLDSGAERLVPFRGPGKPLRYLYPNPVYRDGRLSIRGIGIHETMPQCRIERPEGTGDFFFLLFHSVGEFVRDSAWHRVSAGEIIFWAHAAGHFYGNSRAPWTHSWIHCDGGEVGAVLAAAGVKQNQSYAAQDPLRVQAYLFDLHEEIAGARRPSSTIVRNTLANLVHEAVRHKCRPAPPSAPESLRRARDQLDAGYADKVCLGVLAGAAGLSVPHFCTTFRRHFGRPPLAYLTARRMRVAEALLRGTATPIGEVGRQVGYHDPYYFSKHFKQFYGFAPSVLRRRRESGSRS